MSHNRFDLNMEVVKHLVTVPSAQKTDDVTVNMHTKKSHGACSMERAGINVRRKKPQ